MLVSATIRMNPAVSPADRLLDEMTDYARRIEAAGFPGIWVGDSLGRGRPTLDPLAELAVVAAVTRRVEIGVAVLQLPLRNPIELAHRVRSVQALSGNRLRLGVGSGSTRADFELLGTDYDHRFGAMRRGLEQMRQTWRGEPVNGGGTLAAWPGCAAEPPILMGAWRSPRWITFAAQQCAGWTPSGRFSNWQDLEDGMRIFHAAGGTQAVLANVAIDLRERPESANLAAVEASLVCPPDEARRRLRRMRDIGFTEVLLVSHFNALDELERAREMA